MTPRSTTKRACIVAAQSVVRAGVKRGAPRPTPTALLRVVFERALAEAQITPRDITGIVAVPNLCDLRFLEAHYQATALGLFANDRKYGPTCRTVDTCGASPVTALLEARRMLLGFDGRHRYVAVFGADAVGSLSSSEFLALADRTAQGVVSDDSTGSSRTPLDASPAIVRAYERATRYELSRVRRRRRQTSSEEEEETLSLTRDHLRMALALVSFHAANHPDSLHYATRKHAPYSLDELRDAPAVTENVSIRECARRADGAGCVILARDEDAFRLLLQKEQQNGRVVAVTGGGEASGPLVPPEIVTEYSFGTDRAMNDAYAESKLAPRDIDFFGLYDCFPVCLVRAIEASGLCDVKNDGLAGYLERQHERLVSGDVQDADFFPVNTHGGLMCYGAPFAVPAFYNIVEAVDQLKRRARGRQIAGDPRRALVYGNGGVFSSAAVAILESLDM